MFNLQVPQRYPNRKGALLMSSPLIPTSLSSLWHWKALLPEWWPWTRSTLLSWTDSLTLKKTNNAGRTASDTTSLSMIVSSRSHGAQANLERATTGRCTPPVETCLATVPSSEEPRDSSFRKNANRRLRPCNRWTRTASGYTGQRRRPARATQPARLGTNLTQVWTRSLRTDSHNPNNIQASHHQEGLDPSSPIPGARRRPQWRRQPGTPPRTTRQLPRPTWRAPTQAATSVRPWDLWDPWGHQPPWHPTLPPSLAPWSREVLIYPDQHCPVLPFLDPHFLDHCPTMPLINNPPTLRTRTNSGSKRGNNDICK